MSRLVPYPLLTLGLLLMWLLLNRFSPGHLFLGTAVAIVAGKAMSALEPAKPRIRRWDLIAQLLGVVLYDIVRSNLAVAALILTGGRHGQHERSRELRVRGAAGWRRDHSCQRSQ